MAPIPKDKFLPSKEQSNFRTCLKLYESKQYKKALKIGEGILKKHPKNGDTLALKGLLLYNMNRKEEAEEYIEKGLANDSQSSIVNHITGIYKRMERLYDESLKHETQALEYDPQNSSILRDLALMQVHLRKYDQLVKSRIQQLQDAPGYRQNWTALAVAHHLNGDYATAELTLTRFEEAIKDELPETEKFEHSECLLYKNQIIYESGDVERALQHLAKIEPDVLDKLSIAEYRIKYLLDLKQNNEAQKLIRQLIKRNPDNWDYYRLLEKALDIPSSNQKLRLALYEKFQQFYPKSDVPQYVPLSFLDAGEQFSKAASNYILNQLKRGVPSLFVKIKPLYSDTAKRAIIEKIVIDFFSGLTIENNPSTGSITKDANKTELAPTTWVWTVYFLAQHYRVLEQMDLALSYINKGIEHTPTLVELHVEKARIVKHFGDYVKASESMNYARELDLQDRFVNSKSGKYYLRANNIEKATEVISLFTRNDKEGKGVQDLHDMQASWFLLEQADAYKRLNKTGLALKRYLSVVKIFDEYYNDQMDFHMYCMRRGTPRAYIKMMTWEDELFKSPVFIRASKGAIEIYLDLHYKNESHSGNGSSGLSDNDNDLEEQIKNAKDDATKKKLLKKIKQKKAKENKKKNIERAKHSKEGDDPDPLGEDLLNTKTPTDDANKLWSKFENVAPNNFNTWKLGFEIYLSQKKYILALKAINKIKLLNESDPFIPIGIIRLKLVIAQDTTSQAAIKIVVSR